MLKRPGLRIADVWQGTCRRRHAASARDAVAFAPLREACDVLRNQLKHAIRQIVHAYCRPCPAQQQWTPARAAAARPRAAVHAQDKLDCSYCEEAGSRKTAWSRCVYALGGDWGWGGGGGQ